MQYAHNTSDTPTGKPASAKQLHVTVEIHAKDPECKFKTHAVNVFYGRIRACTESPRLAEHATASACTSNHLHLLVLQKAMLLKLQQNDALHEVMRIDQQLRVACYKNARNVVNATDTEYLKHVAELSKTTLTNQN